MSYKLLVKTHNITGLKYLCITSKEGNAFNRYPGSGNEWKNHLKEFGKSISTETIFESNNLNEFNRTCLRISIENDVAKSAQWANRVLETGLLGFNTEGTIWITDGKENRRITSGSIPAGWKRGRSGKSTAGYIWANNGQENIQCSVNNIPIGFTKGMLVTERVSELKSKSLKGLKRTEETKANLSKSKIGSNNPMFGSKWITDGCRNTLLSKDKELPPGWKFGKTFKPRITNAAVR